MQDVRKSFSGAHMHMLSERLSNWLSFYVDRVRPALVAALPEVKRSKVRRSKVKSADSICAGDIEVRIRGAFLFLFGVACQRHPRDLCART